MSFGQPYAMTAPAPLRGGFADSEVQDVLKRACTLVGLVGSEAELLRGHTNAVFRLLNHPVVVKIAPKGSPRSAVERTIALVRWLMNQGFPTVPLHPVEQPILIDDCHSASFWVYLSQEDIEPVAAADLAGPLRILHSLPAPPVRLIEPDNIAAIRSSLRVITLLSEDDLSFLGEQADRLERALEHVEFVLPSAVVQGDPQHRNALRDGDRTVLCDWDTVVWGRPDWDLVTIEIHCRRFGYSPEHYRAFVEGYGMDIRSSQAYDVLRAVRELRMITTNARKAHHTPGTLNEVRARIDGLRRGDVQQRWHIL